MAVGVVAGDSLVRRDFHHVHRHFFRGSHEMVFRADFALAHSRAGAKSVRPHPSCHSQVRAFLGVLCVSLVAVPRAAGPPIRLALDVGTQRAVHRRGLFLAG